MHQTTNGKFDELVGDFAKEGIELVMPDHKLELPEGSEFLSENAYTKAKAAAEQTGLYSLGDDSGVFIEALDYMPGVHSRRWFGSETDDESRNEKILELMKNEDNRTAYLISRFSLVNPEGDEIYRCVVKNEYSISDVPAGEHGFGYDRILIPTTDMWDYALEHNTENATNAYNVFFNSEDDECEYPTVAEMTQDEKNAITYRGRIAKPISEKLKGLQQ